MREEIVVCDPITNQQHRASYPPDFNVGATIHGVVFCAAAPHHDHACGGCHLSPFKVVLMTMYRPDYEPLVCVYSSETGDWGNLITIAAPCKFFDGRSGSLVGNALYWISMRGSILEFDLDGHILAVIEGPPITNDLGNISYQIMQADDGAVDLAILSYPHLQMWQRDVNCYGVATWVLRKTIEMHNILGLPPQTEGEAGGKETIVGYSEDIDMIFIHVDTYVYMVQLESMQSKRLHQTHCIFEYHLFTSFYTPGTAIAGGCNEAELLHNT